MKKKKNTKIQYLTIEEKRRLLFMSDIHGDIRLFQQALKEVNFSDQDYLFVVGDMIEKGDYLDNIAMLDYILELSKKENVFFMAGNCDEVFRFILPPLDKERFLYFALDKQKSIINDLAERMKVSLSKDMDIDGFIQSAYMEYPQYFEFIDKLPDVIFLNDRLVLVHGGILDIHQIPKHSLEVLKFDRFLEMSGIQPKTMIVGHNPTRNYRSDIACVNPIFDSRKNIICLDGGNNLVKGGQLNVVILEDIHSTAFSFIALDHYPKYEMKEDVLHPQSKNSFTMRFGKNEVDIITRDLDFYLVQLKNSEDRLWVHQDFVFEIEGKQYCYEGSNTFLNLKKGDQISIIKRAMPYSLIKHEGVIGLIETRYLHEDLL